MNRPNNYGPDHPPVGPGPNRRGYNGQSPRPQAGPGPKRPEQGRPMPPPGYQQRPYYPAGGPPRRPNAQGPQYNNGPIRQKQFEQMETQPLEHYQDFEQISGGEGPSRRKKAKSKLGPVIAAVIILVAIAAVVFLLLKPGQGANSADVLAYHENTNKFRLLTADLQEAILAQHDRLIALPNSFSGYQKIQLLDAAHGPGKVTPGQGALAFIDTNQDYEYTEQQHVATIGRLVIPSIGTNGPVADVATDDSLYYGFGVVDFMPKLDEDGMSVILGHRVLTTEAGMMYMDQMKEGDPYYIDDYVNGKRYIYTTRIVENVTEEEYFLRFDPAGRFEGRSTMLVTCDPLIYDESERRILVYGALTDTEDIPADDAFYNRYKTENGLS
ncbi:MAG: sortase [Eubacteriales bacterium]|nr:sortase [Eubacteriales bacterium]